jgi:hypothetical protein
MSNYGSKTSNLKFNLDDYVPVSERIERFYDKYPDGRIITNVIEINHETGFVLIQAMVYRSSTDQNPAATGHATEVRGDSYINKTSFVENCETGAVGRALAMLGFEVKRGIASREEIEKPLRMAAGRASQTAAAEPTPEEQAARLDAEILQSAAQLGYDAAKVRNWVNKKFKVSDGLEALSPELKREVLKTFRANAAQGRGAQK